MRINGTNIKIYEVDDAIGAFDIAVKFFDSDIKLIKEIIEWLSINCTDNFILTETISHIIAGGFSDNALAFENGSFNMSRKNKREHKLQTQYEIRMHKSDFLHFRLRWIDESVREDIEA